MPKIIINELDNTKPGSVAYSNFSVVVPGFVAHEDKADTVFDENGVYEVSSQADFEDNVGKVNPNIRVAMNEVGVKGTVPKAIFAFDRSVVSKATKKDHTVDFQPDVIDYYYDGTYYAKLVGDDKEMGAYNAYAQDHPEDKNYTGAIIVPRFRYGSEDLFNKALRIAFKHATDLEKQNVTTAFGNEFFGKDNGFDLDDSYHMYIAAENKSGKLGYLKDSLLCYTQVEADDFAVPTVTAEVKDGTLEMDSVTLEYNFLAEKTNSGLANPCEFYLVMEGEEGCEGVAIVEDIIHYGNQIAYELLGLGYTVLYKKMNKNYKLSDFGLDWSKTVSRVGEKDTGAVSALTAGETVVFLTGTEKEPDWVSLTDTNTFTIDGHRAFSLTSAITSVTGKAYGKSVLDQLEDFAGFWSCLKDKSTYDFRYIMNGLTTNNANANIAIAKLARALQGETVDTEPGKLSEYGRGDCIALIDVDTKAYTGAGRNNQATAIPHIVEEVGKYGAAVDKYSAIFAPSVTYNMVADPDYGNNCTFPGSFHYLACAAKSALAYNEWYANAGLTRGTSNYTIASTGVKLGEVAIQALEPRYMTPGQNNPNKSINLIVKIKDSFYLWGNRTAHALGTKGASDGELVASHFLNIRQLCCTLKKQIYMACRRFTFDPNSNLLWINFCSVVKPTLEKMKADQGIKDYKFVKDPTDKKALLKAKVRIVPIEAVEDFEITVTLEDSLSGTVDATIEE